MVCFFKMQLKLDIAMLVFFDQKSGLLCTAGEKTGGGRGAHSGEGPALLVTGFGGTWSR